MGFDKRYKGIDEYAVRIIKYKARQLVGRVGFTESDREDLEQEMILDLLQRLPKYDPARAQPRGLRRLHSQPRSPAPDAGRPLHP